MKNALSQSITVRYGLALIAVAAAFSLRWGLDPVLGQHAPLMFFMLAAMVAAWRGGLGPGLAAMVIGELLGDYFFVPPYHTLGPISAVEWWYLLLFFAECGAAVGMIEALRRSQKRVEKAMLLAQNRGEQIQSGLREINQATARIRELASVVEFAQDAIISSSLNFEIRSWNRAAESLFGYTTAEMLGQSLLRLVPPAQQTALSDAFAQLRAGKPAASYETLRLTKDGRELAVSVSLSALLDPAGEMVGVSSIVRDLSAIKRAEQALAASEQRFRVLADAAPVMIWMSDAKRQRTWVNRTWRDFTGRTLAQEYGEGWAEGVYPEDWPHYRKSYEEAFERRESFEIEFRLRHAQGEYRWIFNRGVPHFAADGLFLGYLGSCLDVTERKQAEEALQRKFDEIRATQHVLRQQNEQLEASRRALETERSRYHELFDSAPVGYLITDRQGVIQQANLAAARLFNESPEFLAGFPLARLLGKNDRINLFSNIGRLTRREIDKLENWEVLAEPHAKPAFPCALTANLVHDSAGQLTGLRWLLRDISERKQAEEKILKLNAELEQRVRARTAELEAANRELEAFSYSVSHDLRAPLRSISGFSKAVLEEYREKLDSQGATYLQYAYDASQRMSRLIEDLLAFSRYTRCELRTSVVDLSELAAQIFRELRRADPGREVDISITPGLKARGDEGLLRIALENLLGNAWKFTARQPHPKIELGMIQANGSNACFVRDNGAGFDMAHADRLFGVFQRLHSTDEFPGTGIGLATVRRIFRRHHGDIWAEGKPNHGAAFYFTLPDLNLSPGEALPQQSEKNNGRSEPKPALATS